MDGKDILDEKEMLQDIDFDCVRGRVLGAFKTIYRKSVSYHGYVKSRIIKILSLMLLLLLVINLIYFSHPYIKSIGLKSFLLILGQISAIGVFVFIIWGYFLEKRKIISIKNIKFYFSLA